ncbi:MAG: glycosyl hydrolase family 18 protein [Treponemataceae bacterium]
MRQPYVLALMIVVVSFSAPIPIFAQDISESVMFTEVWAYLGNGDEDGLSAPLPITDAAYFCANINNLGQLAGIPDIGRIAFFKGRKHLVVAELGNLALTHFVLTPEFRLRDALINDIASAAIPYDGIQIDFEAILSKDKEAFLDFLSVLKKKLATKILSVAVPARFRVIDDAYDYERLNKIVDRIVVMAYDEHWSSSTPGPVASLDWCVNVSSYALSKIDKKRLVMGIPFYGRAWPDKNLSRAYKHAGVTRLLTEKSNGITGREKEIPFLEYQEMVTVRLFYEDALSVLSKARLYKTANVSAVAFWRLGQEDPAVWSFLKIDQ